MDYIFMSKLVLVVFCYGVHAIQTAIGVEIVVEPSDRIIAVDSSLWWHCRAVGTGTIKYSWRFNDAFLPSPLPTGIKIFTNGTLFISKVTNNNFGLYQCKAEDAVSSIYSRYATLQKAYMADKFKESPKTFLKFVGETVHFHCAIDSLPYPIITWELNDKPVKDGAVTMVTKTRSQLTFASVDYDNAGTLRCLAKNLALQALKYSAAATLSVEGRPFLKVPPEPTTAVAGTSVILHCLAIGVPAPKVEWSLQNSDKKLMNSSRYLLYPNGSLMILNIQSNDEGFYMCEAKNSWGTNSKTVFLKVEGNIGKPAINYTSADLSVLLGQDVSLRCQASGNPKPTITWSKNGGILPSGRTKLPYPGELRIANVQGSDSGNYICTATNSVGSSFKLVGVTVYSVPSFTLTPKNTAVNEGVSVMLKCGATALPRKPEMAWKTPRSGSLSSQNATGVDGITISPSGNLQIASANQVHAGKYKCYAKNEFGTVTAEAFLTVYIKPVLTRAPKDQKVAEGSSPTIHCRAKGYPEPIVTWLQYSKVEETPVINGKEFRIHSDGSMTIPDVKKRHGGTYKCLARNSAGSAEGVMTLVVLVAPVFKHTPPRLIIKLGANVMLPCSAVGDPPPKMSWERNKNPLILDSNMAIHADHSLSITKILRTQLGEYTCVATNELLSIKATGSVQLRDVPVFSIQPTNTTVSVRGLTEIPCSARARELPMYLWYTSDAEGTKRSLLQPGISRKGQGASAMVYSNGTLKIMDTTAGDEGWYLCLAKNSAGEVTGVAYLNVQEPPQITSTNSPQKVKAKQAVTLSCQSQGDPTPNLSWRRPQSNKPITSSTSEYTLGGDFIRILSVNVKEHFGGWTCVACNNLGCVNKTVDLDVIGRPSLNVAESRAKGNLLTITCSAVGLPVPSIKYFKEEVEIIGTAVPNHVLDGGSLVITNPALDASYKCQAVNVNGVDEKSFKVPTFPDPPSKPTVSNIQSESLTLTWTDGIDNHSPITAYYVYYTLIGQSAKSKVKVGKSPVIVKGLLPFKSYRFEVQSENGVGPSSNSPFSDTVKTLEGAPGQPMNVGAKYGRNSVTLTWQAPSRLNGDPANIQFEITRSIVNSSAGLNNTVYLGYQRPKQYVMKNLERSLTYRFTVKAGNKNVHKWSKPVVIEKSLQETPPAESPQFSRSDVQVQSHDTILLSWQPLDNVYDIQGYIVSFSPETGRRKKRASTQKKTTDTNYTLTGLESGTSYGLQVAGYNRYGTGPFSPRYSVTTKPEPLATTLGLTRGELIGIIIACIILLIFIIAAIVIIIYCCLRHKRRKQKELDLLYNTANGGQNTKPRQLKIPKGMEYYYKEDPSKQKQGKQAKTFDPNLGHKKSRKASGFYDLTSAVYDNVGFYDPPDEYYPPGIQETSHKSQSVKINAKDSDVFFKSKDPDVVLLSRQPLEAEPMEELHVPLPPPRAKSPLGSLPRGPQTEYESHEIVHDSDRMPYPAKSALTKTDSTASYAEIGDYQPTRNRSTSGNKSVAFDGPSTSKGEPSYAQFNWEAKYQHRSQKLKVLKKAESEWERRQYSASPKPQARHYKKRSQTYSTISTVSSQKIPDSRISSDDESDYATVRVSNYHHTPGEPDSATAAMF